MKDQPTPVEHSHFKGMAIKQVDCGQVYYFVLTQEGELHAWGSNKFKQLGLCDDRNSKKDQVKKPKLLEFFTSKGIKVK